MKLRNNTYHEANINAPGEYTGIWRRICTVQNYCSTITPKRIRNNTGVRQKLPKRYVKHDGKGRRRKGSTKRHKFSRGNNLSKHSRLTDDNDNTDIKCTQSGRVIKRHTKARFDRVVVPNKLRYLEVPGPGGTGQGNAMILRPIKEPENIEIKPSYDCEESNFILEKTRLFKQINGAIIDHQKQNDCQDIDFDFSDIQAKGTGFIRCSIKCKNCKFKTSMVPLYAEVDKRLTGQTRGPLGAKGNIRASISMQSTPVGLTAMRLVCAALGLKPISSSWGQKLANRVGEKTVEINTKDMGKWAEDTRSILVDRGVAVEYQNKIDGALDGRYDNVGMKSSLTPGTAATAATGIICETLTRQSKVLGLDYVSKRCRDGTIYERETGRDPRCGYPDCHKGCQASLGKDKFITERAMGNKLAGELLDDHGFEIMTAVTDGDSQMYLGIKDCYEERDLDIKTSNHFDPSHLGGTQRKAFKNLKLHSFTDKDGGEETEEYHPLSTGVFGRNPDTDERWSHKANQACKAAFAQDIQTRCSITLDNTRKHFGNDKKKILKSIDTVREIMLQCYSGYHNRCSSTLGKLTGCKGFGRKSWFEYSYMLKSQNILLTDFTDKEQQDLDKIIALKISAQAYEHLANGYVSSKCEATFSSVNKADPKNSTRVRNGKSRNHCSVLGINNERERATEMQYEECHVALPGNSPAKKVFRDYTKKTISNRENKQRDVSKKRKHERKVVANERWCAGKRRSEGPGAQSDYVKHGREMAELDYQKAFQAVNCGTKRKYKRSYMGKLNNALSAKKLALDEAVTKETLWEKQREDTLKMRRESRWVKEQQVEENRKYFYRTGTRTRQQTRQDHAYSTVPQPQTSTAPHRIQSATCNTPVPSSSTSTPIPSSSTSTPSPSQSTSTPLPSSSTSNVASSLIKMIAEHVRSHSDKQT